MIGHGCSSTPTSDLPAQACQDELLATEVRCVFKDIMDFCPVELEEACGLGGGQPLDNSGLRHFADCSNNTRGCAQ